MSKGSKTVYLKADRNTEVTHKKVMIGDVFQIECTDITVIPKISTIPLFVFDDKNKEGTQRIVLSILKVIAVIHGYFPNIEIQNLGEADFIITYENQKTPSKWMHRLKACFVIAITVFGSAFSTMAFNNDINITKLFTQLYEGITGTRSSGHTILELTYCVGMTMGIFIFFNHFGKKRLTVDPTPMEVEMRLYENDIQTTLIETYARKGKEIDVGTDSFRHHRD